MHFIWFTREPDLIIELEDEEDQQMYGFLVSAACLRVSSRFFDRMLDPKNGFKPLPQTNLNGNPITVLRLHEDSIAALGWILNIIHFQLDSIPREMNRENIFAVAILCDKYLWQRAIGLWAEKWVVALLPNEESSNSRNNGAEYLTEPWKEDISKEGCEEWLFLAQAFPNIDNYTSYHRKVFNTLVEEIVGDMESFDDASRMLKSSRDGQRVVLPVMFERVPQPTFIKIKETRDESFSRAISEMTDLLLEIEILKRQFDEIKGNIIERDCQGDTGCYEVTLASSMGSSHQAGWDLEGTYCPSCIRKQVCLWVVWERVEKLREVLRYYAFAQGVQRNKNRTSATWPNTNETHTLIGNVTSRFGNLWNS
ncbi:hypothetical protein TWF173_006970 [Orbilia oligospora]|nr:hypothetical protein TWF173_006970 [Orbilia oligospora]